jgi:ATP-binding cassette subfamily C (CFTR/MRP) protein 1
LLALLGETVIHKGFISVAAVGGIAYCAQTPWLVNKTIQENILGSSLFDSQWYTKVLKGAALLDDLKNFPAGDRTLVGSQGIILSGGQKQRIVSYHHPSFTTKPNSFEQALARAVYSRSPVIVLDDIFSGLDPMTEEIIFQGLFGANGILRNTSQTIILATHAVHHLPASDVVILLGENGEVIYQGAQTNFPKALSSQRNLVKLSETEYPDVPAVTKQIDLAEQPDFTPLFHEPLTMLDASARDIARQTGDSTVWKYYLKTASYKQSFFFVLLGAICMGFTPAQSLWLNAWANDGEGSKIGYYLGIYSIFFVGEIALTSLWIWHVLIFPLSASSIKLHDIQLDALMGATMNFFSSTDTGEKRISTFRHIKLTIL